MCFRVELCMTYLPLDVLQTTINQSIECIVTNCLDSAAYWKFVYRVIRCTFDRTCNNIYEACNIESAIKLLGREKIMKKRFCSRRKKRVSTK